MAVLQGPEYILPRSYSELCEMCEHWALRSYDCAFKLRGFVEIFPAFCSEEIVTFTVIFLLVSWSDLKMPPAPGLP